jgi:hypothetical protein
LIDATEWLMGRVVNSLLDPVIIFFMLGVATGFLRSNLEVPHPRRGRT